MPAPFARKPLTTNIATMGAEQAAALGLRLANYGQKGASARRVPAGASIVWHAAPSATWRAAGTQLRGPADGGLLECLTPGSGCRAGVSKAKALQQPALAAATSPWSYAARVCRVLQAVGVLPHDVNDSAVLRYAALKRCVAPAYVEAWEQLRAQSAFAGWICKPPSLFEFVPK